MTSSSVRTKTGATVDPENTEHAPSPPPHTHIPGEIPAGTSGRKGRSKKSINSLLVTIALELDALFGEKVPSGVGWEKPIKVILAQEICACAALSA